MSEADSKKVLVNRPGKVTTDSNGPSVWDDPVESAQLELVSTQMLKVMLTSRDQSEMEAIEEAVSGSAEGVLVRNPGSGSFEVISDEELQEILAANDNLPPVKKPVDATLEPLKDYPDNEQLSLVSTQALRRVLDSDENADTVEVEALVEAGAGFNPYDNG